MIDSLSLYGYVMNKKSGKMDREVSQETSRSIFFLSWLGCGSTNGKYGPRASVSDHARVICEQSQTAWGIYSRFHIIGAVLLRNGGGKSQLGMDCYAPAGARANFRGTYRSGFSRIFEELMLEFIFSVYGKRFLRKHWKSLRILRF